jgi:hypothetical protein
MKRCSACGRTYPDDQNFCLDDGTTLMKAPAGAYDSTDAPTVNYPYHDEAPPTVMMQGLPTMSGRPTPTSPPTSPPPHPTPFMPSYAPQRRSSSAVPWIVGGLVVLVLGIALVVFLSSRNSETTVNDPGGTTPGASPGYTPSSTSSPSSPSSASWETVSDDGFTLLMPGKPSKSDDTIPSAAGPLPLRMYTLNHGYEGYITGYTEYPDIVFTSSEPEELLDGAQQGAIQNVKGEVTSQRQITLNGHPGREIVGTSPAQNVGFTARVYLAQPRMYMLVYTQYDKDKPISEHGKKFLDSFQITK